jgi:hypothetical protein
MIRNPEKAVNQYMIRQDVEALKPWIEGFLRDCRVRELSPFAVEYYRAALDAFETFVRAQDHYDVKAQPATLCR